MNQHAPKDEDAPESPDVINTPARSSIAGVPPDVRPIPAGAILTFLARSTVRRGRTPQASDFGKRTRVVPATMPANTALSVAQLTMINLGAMVVLWGAVITVVTQPPNRPRRR